jgi:hypothetical protein
LKAFLLCLLIGGSGVGYVWQKSQIHELGKQMLKREQHLAELAAQNESLKEQLNKMRLPGVLERRIVEMKLGLVRPQPAQFWRLPEPARDSLQAGREKHAAMEMARSAETR